MDKRPVARTLLYLDAPGQRRCGTSTSRRAALPANSTASGAYRFGDAGKEAGDTAHKGAAYKRAQRAMSLGRRAARGQLCAKAAGAPRAPTRNQPEYDRDAVGSARRISWRLARRRRRFAGASQRIPSLSNAAAGIGCHDRKLVGGRRCRIFARNVEDGRID